MNTTLITSFLTVAQTGNLAKAADVCCITPSAMTTRINVLEDELGQKLFNRTRTSTTLTKAGHQFMRYAELMMQTWQQAKNEIALPNYYVGVVNIGIDSKLWTGVVANWVSWIRETLPNLALNVQGGSEALLESEIRRGALDIVVGFSDVPHPDLFRDLLTVDRYVLVSNEPREVVDWDPSYIYTDWGNEFGSAHAIAFPDQKGVSVSEADWALDLIVNSGGSAYFPHRMVSRYIDQGRLFVVPKSTSFDQNVYLLRTRRLIDEEWFSRIIDHLIALTRKQVNGAHRFDTSPIATPVLARGIRDA